MKKNVSTGEAIIRITGGLTLLAWATGKMAKDGSSAFHVVCAALGAQKAGEGVMQYCPMKDLIEREEAKKNEALERI